MELRCFGSTKRRVPVIGQGTWYGENDDRDAAVDALQRGIELGMTHVDTAEMYLSGAAEEWVAAAIEGRRDEVFLVSKVLPSNASRRETVAACERSLARLRTDRLDCYLLHWRGHHPLRDTVDAFEELKRDGKILAWGVSNFDVDDLEELKAVSGRDGPVCDQVLYHLEERGVEHAVLPLCERHSSALVAYSPFGHGQFPDPRTARGRLLRKIAQDHGSTPRQVALRFLLRRDVAFAIPKSSNAEHIQENAGAGDLRLTDLELTKIDKAFAPGPPPSELPML
ncbi:MAG TPA: aldo/keto reductase [Bryobacteraceae bacterium]|nr:aldo/keto reductase [Bryobacteraceae bacterium]